MSKNQLLESPKLPEPTAISRVTCYTASPVHTCDRCGQGIKYVALVTLKDGTSMKYGMDCINKILAGDTSLKGLFVKNQKLLASLQNTLEVLSRPFDQMPVDERGYYDRGFFFVSDDEGKMVSFDGKSYFHPTRVDTLKAAKWLNGERTFDMRGAGPGLGAYEPATLENWGLKCIASIEAAKPKLEAKIESISAFLARILAKGLAPKAEVSK